VSIDTVRIDRFQDHLGREVCVRGWLHNKRSSGKLLFLIVRDGSGFAQAVMSRAAVAPEVWAAAEAAGQSRHDAQRQGEGGPAGSRGFGRDHRARRHPRHPSTRSHRRTTALHS
jgi:hypothetical protein